MRNTLRKLRSARLKKPQPVNNKLRLDCEQAATKKEALIMTCLRAPRCGRGVATVFPRAYFLSAALCIWAALISTPAFADEQQPLRVLTRQVPPFAFQDADGRWQGIAIELWESVAKGLNRTVTYESVTLPDLLSRLTNNQADAAVGALSVTPQREEQFDFSHPFYRTGLGIAVVRDSNGAWADVLRVLVSPRFLGIVGGLLALLTLVGAVIWFLERRHNSEQFPKQVLPGIGSGVWWSSVTMTTVGYGDKAPRSAAGRAVAVVWMFASVVLTSIITASLTSALTVDALASHVQGEGDLARVRTGTVAGSTAMTRLQAQGVSPKSFPTVAAALEALAKNELDAVVYDRPMLRYEVNRMNAQQLHVLPQEFEPQDYAIGLPPGSPLREDINRHLLRVMRSPQWDALQLRLLGQDKP